MGDAESYDLGALRKRFLAALAADGNKTELYPYEVEKHFPRILARIVELWKTPDLDPYFEGLLTTTRHDRQGFPEKVALEIFYLSNLHSSYRLSMLTRVSPWDWSPDALAFKKLH
jgi:hypothetical protein